MPDVSESLPWVALIYSTIEPIGRRGGGIHNAVIGQALGLKANGVHAKILTASEACAAEARERGLAVDLDRAWNSGIDPMFSARIWRNVRRKAGRSPAAVVHNSGRTWLAGRVLFPGAVQAQVLHREIVAPYRFFYNWIALSQTYAEELRRSPSGRYRRIAVAPNGLTQDPPPLHARERSGPVVLGTLGRLGHIKGTDTLIDAATILQRSGIDVRFKIAGEESQSMIDDVAQRGLGNSVEFVGWTDDVDAFYDSVDVFVLPSRKEPFGIVLIEAMARGLPIVSTMTNGAIDIVETGETGWLVPIDDADAMATTLLEVASDRDEICRRGVAAYQAVRAKYTSGPVGLALIEALECFRPRRKTGAKQFLRP